MKILKISLVALCAGAFFLAGCDKPYVKEYKKLSKEMFALVEEGNELQLKLMKKEYEEDLKKFKEKDEKGQEKELKDAREGLEYTKKKIEKMKEKLKK